MDVLRITCLSCYRLQISDNWLKVIMLQLRLVDAGHLSEAQDIEIFKSEVVASNDEEQETSKLTEYEDLLKKGLFYYLNVAAFNLKI